MSDEIPVAFHNDSNYNYHFIIKEIANVFEGQIECVGENTEKYKTFSAPIEKKLQILIKMAMTTDLQKCCHYILQNRIY